MAYHTNMKYNICKAVVEDVTQGVYQPFQIITEKMLSDRFGCSKAPVREALQELCTRRILQSIPRCGYQVLIISPSEIKEILQFRFILEGSLMRSGYQHITQEQLAALEAIHQDTNLSTGTFSEHWEMNAKFHRMLMSCWNNRYASAQLDAALDRLQLAYSAARIDNWDGSTPTNDFCEHANIINSLRSGDIDGAIKALSVDLSYFQELCAP